MQLSYSYNTPMGAAGGIVDLAPHYIASFTNEAANGAMAFGLGVVKGTAAGKGVKIPVAGSSATDFEGIVTNRRTTELDLEGNLSLRTKCALGVMRYGVIYALLAEGATPEYGDAVYMVKTGDDAGKFTDSSSSTVAIKGRFLSGADNGVAIVELFNQSQT
jgi:hypothetical protein